MKHHLLTLALALGIMTSLSTTKAAAQYAPMDMTPLFNQQVALGMIGQLDAEAVGMNYYNMMQYLRANGYDGPSIPVTTPESLQDSFQRLRDSMDAYNKSSFDNSNRVHNAINNWDYRAIRGCTPYVDYYGRQQWDCQ